jgi:hypothetical protein
MLPVWPVIVAAGLVAVILVSRQARQRRLEQLRATWGIASPRVHRMEEIARSHRSRVASRGGPVALDDRTWDDLVLDEVFQRIDHTESTLGRHALYHRLRMAHTVESLRAFESLVTRMSVDAPLRERVHLALGRLRDVHGYDLWWLAQPDAVNVPGWYVVFPILTLATLALLAGAIARHDLLPALIAVLGLSFALNIAALKRVGVVSTAFRQIAPLVATGQALRFLQGEDIDPLVTPLRRDTRSLLPLKTISRWVSGDPLMLSVQSNLAATILSDFLSVVYDYANVVLPLNSAGVYLGIARLRMDGAKLLDMVAAIGDVDAALGVASLRVGQARWTRPTFRSPGSPVAMMEAVHPLVADAVPNSVEMRPGAGMLVTGSNMSGKSTLLRTLGVTAVMAQSLHTCFASAYTAPLLVVQSCIGRADDILAGKSYYMVEVEALLGLVQASAGPMPHLFLLDEMFRGTNAVERIAAGQSVLIELVSDGKPHMVVAATHDNELVDLLAGLYAPFHFGDALTDDTLTFDYHLRAGRATSRNAIALLRLNGAPPALVERALASAAELDRQRAGERQRS